jgi:glycosyltransferase involved in cell wall biosynthesis
VTRAVSFYEGIDCFLLKRFFDRTVAVSPTIFPDKDRYPGIRIITNGIDTDRFSDRIDSIDKTREKFGFTPENFVIGTVGRLSPEKNQSLLLMAFAEVLKSHPEIRLLVVGDGIDKEKLAGLAANLRISPYVVFPGIINDLAPVYRSMDVFVLPSQTEGVPLTILEAMASHVPVIATEVGGVPGIIRDQSLGILADPGDVRGLEQKINHILENKDLRMSIAENAHSFVKQNYSFSSMCSAYEELYQEIAY